MDCHLAACSFELSLPAATQKSVCLSLHLVSVYGKTSWHRTESIYRHLTDLTWPRQTNRTDTTTTDTYTVTHFNLFLRSTCAHIGTLLG